MTNPRRSHRIPKSLSSSPRTISARSTTPRMTFQGGKQNAHTSQKQAPGRLSTLRSNSVCNLVSQHYKGRRSTNTSGNPHTGIPLRNNPRPLEHDPTGPQRSRQLLKGSGNPGHNKGQRSTNTSGHPHKGTPPRNKQAPNRTKVRFEPPTLGDASSLSEETPTNQASHLPETTHRFETKH